MVLFELQCPQRISIGNDFKGKSEKHPLLGFLLKASWAELTGFRESQAVFCPALASYALMACKSASSQGFFFRAFIFILCVCMYA